MRKLSEPIRIAFASGTPQRPLQHDLQNFFPKPDSGETDWQRRNCAFDRHYCKEIRPGHACSQRIRRNRKVVNVARCATIDATKRDECCAPVMRVQMIGGGDLDQPVAAREIVPATSVRV